MFADAPPFAVQTDYPPMIIDSFAGGGGASTGIEMALGRSPDVAINHSADALAMHAVNHPDTLHLDSNIWDVSPREVTKGRPVGLFWASPDCKHFSKAKGGKPRDRNIRDLAWVVVRWAEEVSPDVIILENVEEFRTWGPLYEDGTPIAELRGHTFEEWVRRLKRAGYKVEWRELRACDYGAPTIRKRFFMIARRDGQKIVWPKPTHGDPRKPEIARAIKAGRLKPWRTAAEIIDWSLPCPSIFDTSEEIMAQYGIRAIRPLADATMKRIARGVVRYVLEADRPYIVEFGQRYEFPDGTRSQGFRVSPIITAAQHGGSVRAPDQPVHTITASPKDQNAVIVPAIVRCGGRAGQSAPRGGDEPAGTLTAKADGCVVAPILVETAHGEVSPGGVKRWGSGIKPTDEPMGTGTISGNHAVVAPYLVPRYQEREGQQPRVRSVEEPSATVVPGGNEGVLAAVHLSRFTQNGVGSGADEPVDTVMAGAPKFGVVSAFLAQHNNDSRREGGVNPGRPATEPLATLTLSGSQQQVVAAHLMNMKGSDRRDQPLDKPAPTATAGGTHAALIAPFLATYYGSGIGQGADGPLRTDTTKDRFGLVTVEIDGQTFAIADIGMRMLTPRERFRAQGFPDSYIIDRKPDGSPITATVQGSCCGNSVPPDVAEALVRANCGHLAVRREAAE